MLVQVFNSSDMTDGNLIQDIYYHSSWSSNLFLCTSICFDSSEVECNQIDQITCPLSDSQSGSVLQEVTINTSRNVNLYLGNKFGSLVLGSCDAKDCVTNIDYTYVVENIGATEANLTTFERVRFIGDATDPSNLQQQDTKDLRSSETVIIPGTTAFGGESELYNLCSDSYTVTNVTVAATPPDGILCADVAMYSLETSVCCRVNVEITYMNKNNVECKNLQTITDPRKITLQIRY